MSRPSTYLTLNFKSAFYFGAKDVLNIRILANKICTLNYKHIRVLRRLKLVSGRGRHRGEFQSVSYERELELEVFNIKFQND